MNLSSSCSLGTVLAVAILGVAALGCNPDPVMQLNGKSASFRVERQAGEAVQLIDREGRLFSLESDSVTIHYELHVMGSTHAYLTHGAHVVELAISREMILRPGDGTVIPAAESGQPVTLVIRENSKHSPPWITYRKVPEKVSETDPVCVETMQGYQTCTPGTVTTEERCYRDTNGIVERNVTVEIRSPEITGSRLLATLATTPSRQEERLSWEGVSIEECRAHLK